MPTAVTPSQALPSTADAPADDARAGGAPGCAETTAGAVAARAPTGDRLARWALLVLPGALVVFFGFNAGGYFPATPAIAAVVLAQALLLRVVGARRPCEGLAPATVVAIVALAGYGALTLASALWSHSLGRALIETDRVWLYLLALTLFGLLRADADALRWLIRGLLLGVSVVCLAGLTSRVAPDVWHTAPGVANERLSYPVTYWNALGLLAALGIVLAAHTTCSLGERPAVRALAAAALPLLGATLFFTFSRGAIAAGVIGLLAYVLVGRPRALVGGLLAATPATAVLVLVAYHANLLDTIDPTTPAAVRQGHRVAFVALACAACGGALRLALAARLDGRLAALAARRPLRAGAKLAVAGVPAVLALVLALAAGVPSTLAHDWHRFASGAQPHGEHGDLRRRLTDPSNNQRTLLWKAAVQGFADAPSHGHGAGTFQEVWDRRRPSYVYTVNAHSLYLQTMAELGVPGLALIVVLLLAALGGLALRARGPNRSLYGVLLAAGLVWALHAGVDWDWEMPVVSLPFFAAAGLALSPRRREEGGGWVPSQHTRLLLGLACLATLALPVLVIGSQRHLDDAKRSLYASRCVAASSAASASIDWLDVRAQPYEVLGFCDLQRGFPHLALEAMSQAVERDPGSWEARYELAIAKAAAGVDPRGAIGRALAMDPLDPLVRAAARQLSSGDPVDWVRRAAGVRKEALASDRLAIAPA